MYAKGNRGAVEMAVAFGGVPAILRWDAKKIQSFPYQNVLQSIGLVSLLELGTVESSK